MPLTLSWRDTTTLFVDGSPLQPRSFAGQTVDQVRRTPLRAGNQQVSLGDLFQVSGDLSDETLHIEGDLRHVHGIGRGMAGGTLMIQGDVGDQLGAEASGGRIELTGSAGDRAGAELRGGRLVIKGDAGSSLGAAYPGSRLGMREGVILVEGSAGDDVGLQMRRGLIAIRGRAGKTLGRAMIAGTILVLGDVGGRIGIGMKRGTLVLPGLVGDLDSRLLPTFQPAGRFRMPYLEIYRRQLDEWGFPVPRALSTARLERYNGDLAANGQGEVLSSPEIAFDR